MPVRKYLIASSVVGGLVLAAGIVAVALSEREPASTVPPGELEVVVRVEETENGVCRPETFVTVNKQAQGFYALYGEERYIDTRDDTSTGLPLQWVFRGWNDEGMSEFRSTTGINTQTPCADLKIAYEIKECLYDQSRHEPRACPEIHLNGEGFAGIVIETDRSQDLPEIEGTE